MTEENKSPEFRLRKIDETRKDLMSKNHNKVCTALNYVTNYLYYIGCVSISAFASLLGIAICSWIKKLCNICSN